MDDNDEEKKKVRKRIFILALTLYILANIAWVLIQDRKNVSLEVIFLLTIFIGGFMFHILWEAKSRYIIPYIVVLIPIASISTGIKILKTKLR